MNPRIRTPGKLRSLIPWAVLGFAGFAVGAGLERMVLNNFSVCPAYYPPPHQTQKQYYLEGARGEPVSSNLYLVAEARLQHFRTNGERELIVQAPQCTYDSGRRSVSSPGSLQVMAAEGKFSITGEGFLWQQTNTSLAISNGASLSISNRVHSIVHRDLLARGEAPQGSHPAGGADLEVFSDQFDYSTDSGQGVYRRNVHVTGTNLNLTAGLLSIDVPMQEHQLRRVTAQEAVVVDYQGVHASGDLATYSPLTDLLEVTGHPTWQDGEIRGHGDEVTIDATNRIFLTKGNAFLRMPGRGLGVTGLLPSTNAAASAPPQGTNTFVEVYCDQYDLRTNRAVFQKNVRLSELEGAELKGRMSCGQMTLTHVNTNQLERMVADQNVVIERESQRLTCVHAVYDATNGVLDLIDHPAWQDGPSQGRGDSIKINRQREEMLVLGNASMRLPAAQMGSMSFSSATATNAPASTNESADIFSDSYTVGRETARFEGGVRIVHPRILWACQEMTVGMPPAGGRVGEIVADRAVEFDLLDEKGEKTHGTGDRAVYTYSVTDGTTNEVIKLTGNPTRLIQTNSVQITTNIAGVQQTITVVRTNFNMVGGVLLFDRVRNSIITPPGDYGVRIPGSAASPDTIGVQSPKDKKRKPKK